ncbi:type ISP restriction/modification enzyme [Bartonella sp. B12(2025)]
MSLLIFWQFFLRVGWPFIKNMLYFDRNFNNSQHRMPKIFSDKQCKNLVIVVRGSDKRENFSSLIVDTISDYSFSSSGNYFPLYLYEKVDSSG